VRETGRDRGVKWIGIFGAACCLAFPVQAETGLEGLDLGAQCLSSPYQQAETPAQERLRDLVSRLRAGGPDLAYLDKVLAASQPDLCIDDRSISERGYFNVDLNLIALSDRIQADEMLAILMHELRHADQLIRGYCPSNKVSMAENARATFAIEADAMAMTALSAWTLRSQGDDGPWQAMLSWERYSDIAERFETEITASGSANQAAEAAFTQWFASEWRTWSYYSASCGDYLDRQDRSHALPRYDLLPDDFYARLCRMPDGTPYDCRQP
jgi:hypothetical protein